MERTFELIRQSQAGEKLAKEQLITMHSGLIWNVVRRFTGRGVELEDLYQIGAIGLIRAIDKFDFSFEVKFSTYAVPLISGEIKRFLRDDGAVKVSRSIKEQASLIKTSRNRLTNALGREPTIQEISRQTGLTPEEIAIAETATAATESIQKEAGEEGFSLEDVLTDTESEDRMVEKIALRQAIDKLPNREAMVIRLRYFHGLTQDRTAKVMEVSQVQVSRIEKKAISMLSEMLRS